MQRTVWSATVLLLALPQSAPQSRPATPAAAPATGFLFKTVAVNDRTWAYSVYVPPEYSTDTVWPVILYLHGSGTRGTDGLKQTDTGIARAIRRNRLQCPAIVVMPQCSTDSGWTEPMLRVALACMQKTAGEYRLDAERVYLTGQSLGGGGAWVLAAWIPDRFAAVAPICGFVGRPDAPPNPQHVARLARQIRDVPIWCFHGREDQQVSVAHSRAMVDAIRRVGGNVKYTEYPENAHKIWDRVYGTRAFWKWLLGQRRPVAQNPTDSRESNP